MSDGDELEMGDDPTDVKDQGGNCATGGDPTGVGGAAGAGAAEASVALRAKLRRATATVWAPGREMTYARALPPPFHPWGPSGPRGGDLRLELCREGAILVAAGCESGSLLMMIPLTFTRGDFSSNLH